MLGYRVLEADSGAAALDMLDDTTAGRHAVRLRHAGDERGRAGRPARASAGRDVPIVFASGHADTEAVEEALGGEAMILRKPFDMESLARALAGLSARR